MEILQTLQILRKELKKLENLYYSGKTVPHDEVYDYKLRELIRLENLYPHLITSDSPSQKIGFSKQTNMDVKHEIPMLSLNNAFDTIELQNFFKQCEKYKESPEYIIEPKIDGASISLKYKNGYLEYGLSRGDGEYGENLTNKLLQIQNIPLKLPETINITVRGEIYIKKSDFQSINKDNQFANHRNYVAGCLRLKNANELENKKIKFRAYQILNPDNFNLNTQKEIIDKLKDLKFEIHKHTLVTSDKKQIYEFIEKFREIKTEIDIPCDGLVIKINNFNISQQIGFTSKYPKWAIAYKYPSLIKESKLLRIFATVGRTGKITYSGQIEETEIDGSLIQYATLHNKNYIQDLDIRIGDYVHIHKSGEIIPKIIGVNRSKRSVNAVKWIAETECPSCKTKLIERENLQTQFCTNEDCKYKKIALLSYWSSKAGVDIVGMSTKIITKFYELNLIKEITDIYKLHNHKEFIINSNIQIKEKTINKLLLEISKSKNSEFKKILTGLGIMFLGEESAYFITQKYKNIDDLMEATEEDLLKIEGIGQKTAQSLFNWLQKNKNLIDDLKEIGFFKNTEIEITHNFLTQKNVVITGTLSIPRDKVRKILENKYGAIVKSTITSKTDYLIAGSDSIEKVNKAKEKKIKILQEVEIINLLHDN